MKKTLLVALLLSLCALIGGCATAMHPGATSAFDSQAWDDLLSVQTGIEQAKADYLADTSPTKDHRQATVINDAAKAYTTVERLFKNWACAQSTTALTPEDIAKRTDACRNYSLSDASKVPNPVAIKAQIASLLAIWGKSLSTLHKGGVH